MGIPRCSNFTPQKYPHSKLKPPQYQPWRRTLHSLHSATFHYIASDKNTQLPSPNCAFIDGRNPTIVQTMSTIWPQPSLHSAPASPVAQRRMSARTYGSPYAHAGEGHFGSFLPLHLITEKDSLPTICLFKPCYFCRIPVIQPPIPFQSRRRTPYAMIMQFKPCESRCRVRKYSNTDFNLNPGAGLLILSHSVE